MTTDRGKKRVFVRSKASIKKGVHLSYRGVRRHPMIVRAASGHGKSRLQGRLLAFQDLINGVPQIIYDPLGPTIDNLFDKLARLPLKLARMGYSLEEIEAVMANLWSRVRYVDMSGELGGVPRFPFIYRLGNESLFTIGTRFGDVVTKLDPNLAKAPILGLNAFDEVCGHLGMLLAALGMQFTEAVDALHNPEPWINRAKEALDRYPDELPQVITWLKWLAELSPGERQRQTGSFFAKVFPFQLDPVMKAMHGASEPEINWRETETQGLCWALDFRRVTGKRKLFLMRWCYEYLYSFIRHRGIAGRNAIISLIVDELAALFPLHDAAANQFAADLDELVNQIARNNGLFVCLATQEYAQFSFSPMLIHTLLNMRVQIQGATGDVDTAELLARKFDRYFPLKEKYRRTVWITPPLSWPPVAWDSEPEWYTPEEQFILASYRFLDLPKFEFLVSLPKGEGDAPGQLIRMSIENIDSGEFPRDGLVEVVRRELAKGVGVPLKELLEEIEARRQRLARLSAGPSRPSRKRAKPALIPASGLIDPD